MQIFVSYRRDDSAATARLVHNELSLRFGTDSVFMDLDDIGYGDDFVDVIDQRILRTDVVVVMIGPRWAEIIEQRLRGDDWVRHEVRAALTPPAALAGRRVRIVPILVGDVLWPGPALPTDIARLQRLSAVTFQERALKAGITAIVEAIQQEGFEDRADRLRRQQRARWSALGLGAILFAAGWLALLDRLTVDTRAAGLTMGLAAAIGGAGPTAWSGQVVLLGIDNATEARIGRPFDASWRSEHARVIENAAAAGARSIVFDAVLEDAGNEQANLQLEQALDAVRGRLPVVFGVQLSRNGQPLMLARFGSRVLQGVACAGSKLGQVRSMPLVVQGPASAPAAAPAPRPALALAAYLAGGTIRPLDEAASRVLAAREPESTPVEVSYFAAESVSGPRPECSVIGQGDRVALQLLDPQRLPAWRLPPRRLGYEQVRTGDAAALAGLKGKIVLVGLMRAKDEDYHAVGAGDGDSNRWGVELIASQIDALVQQQALRPLGAVAEAMLAGAAALAGASLAIVLRRHPRGRRVAAQVLASLAVVLLAALWYHSEQQLINWPYGVLALLGGAWLTTTMLNRGR